VSKPLKELLEEHSQHDGGDSWMWAVAEDMARRLRALDKGASAPAVNRDYQLGWDAAMAWVRRILDGERAT
jgi:hypothetical protein